MTWDKYTGSAIPVKNWALCTSAVELALWVPPVFGKYPDGAIERIRGGYEYVLTGFEIHGHCWWCGKDLTSSHGRKFCTSADLGEKHGHGLEYCRHFQWAEARSWCLRRHKGLCANCGKDVGLHGLEVHHIIPLEGETRLWSPFNLPWNLIGLCHECHLEIGAAMRPPKVTEWELRLAAGQIPLLEALPAALELVRKPKPPEKPFVWSKGRQQRLDLYTLGGKYGQ